MATAEQCNDIKAEIVAGLKFSEAAAKYSTCPSKSKGGNLGEFEPGQMVAEFDEVCFNEEKYALNELHGPVRRGSADSPPFLCVDCAARLSHRFLQVQTQFGYHLVVVTDRKLNQDRSEGSPAF